MINKEAVIDDLENRKMSLDDTFYYGCMQCGKCCHDIDIILNPYDLYRLAKYLKLSTEDVIMKYCLWYIGEASKFPIVVLDFTEDRACPFLKQNRCAVHEAKPFVCSAYPLGRAYLLEEDQTVYFMQSVMCGLPYKKHTVQEWIYADRDVAYEEEIHKVWTQIISEMMDLTRQNSENIIKELCGILLTILYTGYDTEMDFLEQLNDRAKKAKKFACEVKKIHERIMAEEKEDGK